MIEKKSWGEIFKKNIEIIIILNYTFYGFIIPTFVMFLTFVHFGFSFEYFIIGIASLMFLGTHIRRLGK